LALNSFKIGELSMSENSPSLRSTLPKTEKTQKSFEAFDSPWRNWTALDSRPWTVLEFFFKNHFKIIFLSVFS